MLETLKKNIGFILLCFLWYYIGKSNNTVGVILVCISFLFFIIRKMEQQQLLTLIYLIVLSDNYFIYFASSAKPIILVFLSIYVFINKEISLTFNLHKSFLPFIVLATLTLFLTPKFEYSFQKYASYILLLITIPPYCVFLVNKYGTEFLKNWIMICFLLIVISLLSKYLNPGYAISHEGRLRGVFGNPNGLAIFCTFSIMFFEISRSHFKCEFSRIELWLFYLLVLLTLWWSGSRSALVALTIFIVFSRIGKLSPFLGMFLLITIIFLYEYIINLSTIFLIELGFKKQLRLEGSQGIESASGRIIAWRFAWQEIEKNFLLGLGWAYDELLFGDPKVQARLNALNHQGGVHNSYLIFWLNQGLIGLAFYLIALVGSFIKAAKNSIYALPVMYSCFFMANFEPWMASSLNPYTIQMIMMLSLFIYIHPDDIDQNTVETKANEVA